MEETCRVGKSPRLGRPRGLGQGETRQRILDEALAQFSLNGFDGTSVRQIAKAVGVTEAAIYSHFASKDAIMDRLWEEHGINEAIEVLRAHGLDGSTEGWEKQLAAFVDGIIETWSTPRERMFSRLMLNQTAGQGCHAPKMKEAIQSFDGILRDLFARLSERNLIKPADPEVLVLSFLSPLILIKHKFLTFDDPTDGPEAMARRAARLASQHVAFFVSCIKA